MTNRAEVVFYRDDDSIATMENGVELALVIGNSTVASLSKLKNNINTLRV